MVTNGSTGNKILEALYLSCNITDITKASWSRPVAQVTKSASVIFAFLPCNVAMVTIMSWLQPIEHENKSAKVLFVPCNIAVNSKAAFASSYCLQRIEAVQ